MLAVVVHSYTVMFLGLYEFIIVFLKIEYRGILVTLLNVSDKPSAILHPDNKVEQKNKKVTSTNENLAQNLLLQLCRPQQLTRVITATQQGAHNCFHSA
jgi:hypothetical protein